MNSRWAIGALLLLLSLGCGPSVQQNPPANQSTATVDVVCDTVAELLNVKREKVTAATTLGELGCDELDVVELVMELEERFEITIPDDSAEISGNSQNKAGGFAKTTMRDMAGLVDKRRQAKSTPAMP